MESELVLRGKRVALSEFCLPGLVGGSEENSESALTSTKVLLVPASIRIQNGRITAIAGYDEIPPGSLLETVGEDSIVMPGLVDTHVHINEPGRTVWEGFATATRAAAAGGVTTLVDMPLNSIPPTTTAAGLRAKIGTAREQCSVDVGFWGGVVPGNTRELAALF